LAIRSAGVRKYQNVRAGSPPIFLAWQALARLDAQLDFAALRATPRTKLTIP